MSWFSASNPESSGSDKSLELRQMERNLAREAMRAMSAPAAATSVRSSVSAAPAMQSTLAAVPATSGSVLGPSLRFKGELRADEDFTLQGRIEGTIHHTRNLGIGPEGFVKGDSRAQNIVVDGTIEGDLYALESISLRPTAKVTGNLYAPRVSIADGASFNGKVDMVSAAKAARSVATHMSADHSLTETQVIDALTAN